MPTQDSFDIARNMLRRHGLQAYAVALERIREMRLAGDTAGLGRWQQVLAMIQDRRYAPARSGPVRETIAPAY